MEAVLMADFDHRNVMWLIAIIIDSDMVPHVILPLMQHGDLRSFVSKPANVSVLCKCILVIFLRGRHLALSRYVGLSLCPSLFMPHLYQPLAQTGLQQVLELSLL